MPWLRRAGRPRPVDLPELQAGRRADVLVLNRNPLDDMRATMDIFRIVQGGHVIDREDLAGRPFVGPAGNLLDEALREAGIDREKVYVTNVVKHFKWVPSERGKRRIHKKPRYSEILACRPWLDAEIRLVRPQILVCLGATAAQSLLGKDFSVSRQRGQLIPSALAPHVVATVHPSSILRVPHDASRKLQMEAFVQDLKTIARLLKAEESKAEKIKAKRAS